MSDDEKGGALDLSGFDDAIKKQDEGVEVDILGLDGKTPIGLKIRIAGPDSKRAQDATDELADELINQQNGGKITGKDARKRGATYLAKITLGWAPAVKLDGKDMPCTETNAAKVYNRFRFIRDQVDRAAGDRSRFTQG